MRALARLPPASSGSARSVDILRALWMQRLPEAVRAAMPDTTDKTDSEVVTQADHLLDAHAAASHHHVNAIPSEDEPSAVTPAEDVLAV